MNTAQTTNNRNEKISTASKKYPDDRSDIARLKSFLHLLEHAKRNSPTPAPSSSTKNVEEKNHDDENGENIIIVSSDLERAFNEIFHECDRLLLLSTAKGTKNDSDDDDQGETQKIRALIDDAKGRMLRHSSNKKKKPILDDDDDNKNQQLEKKKEMAALGLI